LKHMTKAGCDTFFFQAEDGIRDGHVTGVQTLLFRSVEEDMHFVDAAKEVVQVTHDVLVGTHQKETEVIRLLAVAICHELVQGQRSEERRVGKECRSGWVEVHEMKVEEIV